MFKPTAYSTFYDSYKYKAINYKHCKGHLDFNKFIYKNGHKVYMGPSQEVRDLFNKEKQAHNLWNKLKGNEERRWEYKNK